MKHKFTITIEDENDYTYILNDLTEGLTDLYGEAVSIKRYQTPSVNASYVRSLVDLESKIKRLTQECNFSMAEIGRERARADKAEGDLTRLTLERDAAIKRTIPRMRAEAADLRQKIVERTNERDKALADKERFERLFDKQRERTVAAGEMWRQAHPGNDLVSPDLGALVQWLIDRGDEALAKVERMDAALNVALPHLEKNARFLRDVQADAGEVGRAFQAVDAARAARKEPT